MSLLNPHFKFSATMFLLYFLLGKSYAQTQWTYVCSEPKNKNTKVIYESKNKIVTIKVFNTGENKWLTPQLLAVNAETGYYKYKLLNSVYEAWIDWKGDILLIKFNEKKSLYELESKK